MGLDVSAKGLTVEDSFCCGYITFMVFRKELAKTYNPEIGRIYEKWVNSSLFGEKVTNDEVDCWNKNCDDGLDIFLFHSDCDGKFTPQECRKIYNAIKDLKMDMQGHNYGVMKPYNMLEQWKGIFKHCYKNRVNLYFG